MIQILASCLRYLKVVFEEANICRLQRCHTYFALTQARQRITMCVFRESEVGVASSSQPTPIYLIFVKERQFAAWPHRE